MYNVLFFAVALGPNLTARRAVALVWSELQTHFSHGCLPLIPLLMRREENPAFSSICSYVRAPASLSLPGLDFEEVPREWIESAVWKTRTDTSWILHETQNRFYGYLCASSAHLTEDGARQLALDYARTVERFAEAPDAPLASGPSTE
jgi:hypothetical protein